jgi:hypothetical protein
MSAHAAKLVNGTKSPDCHIVLNLDMASQGSCVAEDRPVSNVTVMGHM